MKAAIWEARVFNVLMLLMMLLVMVVVVASVGAFFYFHTPGPDMVGMAKVKITGTGHFQGNFGTEENTYFVEANAPATIEVYFARSDWVMADLEELPGEVKIKVGEKIVDKGTAGLGGASAVWRVPRDFKAD